MRKRWDQKEKKKREGLETSSSSSPFKKNNKNDNFVASAHTDKQRWAHLPLLTWPLVMWGLRELRCHGNWTSHNGPWREGTEPYLSTFTSPVTGPSCGAAAWTAIVCEDEPVNASSFHSLIHSLIHSSVRLGFNVYYFPAADMKGECLIEVSPEICFGAWVTFSTNFQELSRQVNDTFSHPHSLQ